jgi:hypothetical protein
MRRYRRSVTVTSEEFVAALAASVPETSSLVAEHLDDNDGLLLHLLLADLLRLAVGSWHNGDTELSSRLLSSIDWALHEGDEYVQNAVCVSFVEHVGAGEGETPEFIASWPEALTAEVALQQRQ